MTDENGGQAATVDTTTTAPEAVVSSQATETVERNFETEARDMGWVPETEWKGDKKPAKFLSAEEFVDRGSTLIPILNKRLKDKDAEYAERFKKMEAVNAKTIERVQKDAEEKIAALTAERRDAIKAGDVDKVEKLDGKISDLKEDATPADKKLTGAALEKHNEKAQKDWIGKQAWWDVDEDLTAFAIGKSQKIAATNPDITIEDNLAKVEAALREKFPEKFGGKKADANGHAPVDSGGDFPGGGKASILTKLPNEARAQAKADMKAFPKIYPTEESWVLAYDPKLVKGN